MEARGFREASPELRSTGVAVVGVSADRPPAQARFAAKLELDYLLLCDPAGEVLRAYGVRSWLGLARRRTFLIDAEGTVRKVYTAVSPAGHAREVLADLQAGIAGRA